jgi:predicted GNAT superfamily acetyltransferase
MNAGAPDADLVFRPLAGRDEYDACVRLQRETWGEDFGEVVPPTILWLAQRMGGVASGAFTAEGTLAGFVFGLTGVSAGRLLHWSDMLAVRAAFRGHGVGVRLKWHQRELLLARGVDQVSWTFDPLDARNAHINFTRLGIHADAYLRDVYGPGNSPLHAGIGTDRLVARWLLNDAGVVRRASAATGHDAGQGAPVPAHAGAPLLNATALQQGWPASAPPAAALVEHAAVRIAVPADIHGLKAARPALARDWREKTRSAFEQAFDRGFVAVAFQREPERARGCYTLERTALSSERTPLSS